MNENKQLICDMLCKTLQYTRSASDVIEICYDDERETATVIFESGGKRVINVEMIRDIMKNLGC